MATTSRRAVTYVGVFFACYFALWVFVLTVPMFLKGIGAIGWQGLVSNDAPTYRQPEPSKWR